MMKQQYLISKYQALPSLLLIVLFIMNITMSHAQNSLNPYRDARPLNSLAELDYGYPVKYVSLANDINLAYVDQGSGPQTIIFIHGLGSYLKAWTKNIDGLKDYYRCIAIDLPGYGKSSKVPHSGMMTFYAEVVKDMIEELGLQNVVLAGHSMGGQIAMMAAINYPKLIQKLILASPAGFEKFTEGQKQWFRDVMTLEGVMQTTVEQIQTNLAYNFYQLPDDAEFMIIDRIAMRSAEDFEAYSYAVVQSVNGMVDEPVLEMLDKIKQPTLIIFGENDNLIPNRFLNAGKTADVAKVGHSRIPNSELLIISRAGHFVQFEKAETFNQAVISFLGKR